MNRNDRAARSRIESQLPVVVDLLAAAIEAGTSPQRAAEVIGAALEAPAGPRLREVARALRYGVAPGVAWRRLEPAEGAERIVRIAARSSATGAGMARSLRHLATDLRARRASAAEAAAYRASVLAVLPMGCCFLPAFILLTVFPILATLVIELS